jgi:hypothetical protein|tara:strand:- start:312 stop:551 length:240 start_codon:yes stop_codon:yes gene_type:complete
MNIKEAMKELPKLRKRNPALFASTNLLLRVNEELLSKYQYKIAARQFILFHLFKPAMEAVTRTPELLERFAAAGAALRS